MPFKDKEKRREWETSPEQKAKALDRKQRERERREKIDRLQAAATIVDRCRAAGREPDPNVISPKLIKEIDAHRPEIEAFWHKRDAETTEVVIGGKVCEI